RSDRPEHRIVYVPGRHANVVVEPTVPAETADLFRDHRTLLLRIRAGWTPPNRRRPPALGLASRMTATLVALLSVGAGFDFFFAGLYTPFVVVMTLAALLIVGVLAKPRPDAETERRHLVERQVYYSARRFAGRYVLHEDLDEDARKLMTRAQDAIGSVMESHVHARGLLDDVRNTVMLPAQE